MGHVEGLPAVFNPGNIAATKGFMDKCPPKYALAALAMHLVGKWGTVCPEDAELNDIALKDGNARLLSKYPLPDDPGDFWIITEADRSATTFLLPSEY